MFLDVSRLDAILKLHIMDLAQSTRRLDSNKFDFILNSISTLYSNPEATKIITLDNDPGEKSDFEITKCPLKVLENLIHRQNQHGSNDGFICYFLNSVRSFHNAHRCSTKTAICFTIFLWKRICATHLFDCESDRDDIVRKFLVYMKQVLYETIALVRNNPRFSIQTDKLLDRGVILGICRGDETSTEILDQLLVKHHEYGASFVRENIFINISNASNTCKSSTKLAFEIVEGHVYPVTDSFANLNAKKCHVAIMFDSSLRHDHVHLGFNKNLEATKFKSTKNNSLLAAHSSSHETWRKQVESIFDRFKISLIIVRGTVDSEVAQFCGLRSILVISRVDSSSFENIRNDFRVSPVVYIEDLEQSNLFEIRLEKVSSTSLSRSYVKLKQSRETNKCKAIYFTVLLENRFKLIENMLRENLEHNLSRIDNVLKDALYLRGGGLVERSLSDMLFTTQMISAKCDHEKENERWIFEIAKETLAHTFRDMCSLIREEEATKKEEKLLHVYDDFTSKTLAWKFALVLNNILLNSDYSICY